MNEAQFDDLLANCSTILYAASREELYEEAIRHKEGCVGIDGQLCVATGRFTGRAANDKYIVTSADAYDKVEFGAAGKALDTNVYGRLLSRVQAYLHGRQVYVMDFDTGFFKCRVVTELAWQGLFVSNLFKVSKSPFEKVDLTIVAVPGCTSGGINSGFNSDAAIACNFDDGLVLITGTAYAGEIKKSVFTYASYVLPLQGKLPMHSSVTSNDRKTGTAVFFGLSGTGKTTLSAESSDVSRRLLGDDEHVWSDEGISNLEAGCYAKAINLDYAKEPGIYTACRTFKTVLENVMLKEDRTPDFASNKLTENTRAAYPLTYIKNALTRESDERVNVMHPDHIIMLTCDAYGILPSVSKLSFNAAIYHFLSGYTAKIAGTESGIKEPKATFSRCFGAPFMPLTSEVYADLLLKHLNKHKPDVWLVNTGWAGGPYGIGNRIDVRITRKIIDDIISGQMSRQPLVHYGALNLDVPESIANSDLRWSDLDAYARARDDLIKLFQQNAWETMRGVSNAVLAAGPSLVSSLVFSGVQSSVQNT